jgi:predicted DNA-binding transcriptional regulator AlpA
VFVPFSQLAKHGADYSRVHLRRLIERELFPPPIQLSPNRIAWRLSDLARWKATRPVAPIADEQKGGTTGAAARTT